jgi:pyruvate formate lyase activating enzyme
VDPAIPWHLNAFVPRYRMSDRPPTGPALLLAAAGSACARGLLHVYAGNLASEVTELSHTRCLACHAVVIRRRDYATTEVALRDVPVQGAGRRSPASGRDAAAAPPAGTSTTQAGRDAPRAGAAQRPATRPRSMDTLNCSRPSSS